MDSRGWVCWALLLLLGPPAPFWQCCFLVLAATASVAPSARSTNALFVPIYICISSFPVLSAYGRHQHDDFVSHAVDPLFLSTRNTISIEAACRRQVATLVQRVCLRHSYQTIISESCVVHRPGQHRAHGWRGVCYRLAQHSRLRRFETGDFARPLQLRTVCHAGRGINHRLVCFHTTGHRPPGSRTVRTRAPRSGCTSLHACPRLEEGRGKGCSEGTLTPPASAVKRYEPHCLHAAFVVTLSRSSIACSCSQSPVVN